MKWAAFKQMNIGELIDYVEVLSAASTIERGDAVEGLEFNGVPIVDDARELFLDFLDAATPFEGTMEVLADTAIAAVANGTDWVDKALNLVRFAAPVLEAQPLARLPF